MPKSKLYRTLWVTGVGYVVYRHCVEDGKAAVDDIAREHKQAVFVTELAANDYCRYRNDLIDKVGSDALASSTEQSRH